MLDVARASIQGVCGRGWPYNDTYKDSQLNCTIFGHVCWTFFYLVFLNQNCTVFDICDTSAMTVLIRGSKELLCWWYFTNSFRLQTVGFPFLPGVREQQMIGLQIIRHLDVTYFLDSSRRGTSKRACCDTLICLTMLQCMIEQQLQDNLNIDNIVCPSMIPLRFLISFVFKHIDPQ